MAEYLEDIKSAHEDNWQYILKDMRWVSFRDVTSAREFRMQCMNFIMEKLGFDPWAIMNMAVTAETAAETMQQLLDKNKIKIEDWTEVDCENSRKGQYVYKAGEIVAFISLIKKVDWNNYMVATNIKFQ